MPADYIVNEIFVSANGTRNATSKARDDVSAICARRGFVPLDVVAHYNPNGSNGWLVKKVLVHKRVQRDWKKALAGLGAGDSLLIQFPPKEDSELLASLFDDLATRDVKVTLVVHDMETFRLAQVASQPTWRRVRRELLDRHALAAATNVIVHNTKMQERLESLGAQGSNLIPLGLFDYLIDGYDTARMATRRIGRNLPVIVAGNLKREKAGYLYDLPQDVDFNLFGVGYDEPNPPLNVHYLGSFDPSELPYALTGSFGLVWDGESAQTCQGVYGEYLRINNPHKTSLYLASGLPVIVWSQAAVAEVVSREQCGLVVDNLAQLRGAIDALDGVGYDQLRHNAERMGEKLRAGHFLEEALRRARLI